MRVIVSAGGTGGHIYPALAIIDKIKEVEPNSEILYIGTHNRMEKDIVPKRGINYKSLTVTGFKRSLSLSNFKTITNFLSAIKEAKKIMREFKPDVVIGVGGYVTAPVIYAASKLKIPTFIHEQNSIPGLSNKFLSRYVTKIGVSFKDSIQYFDKGKVVYTGNPCSEEALNKKQSDKKSYDLSISKQLVLIVMGSLGSSTVNKKISEMLPLFNNKEYEIMFVTGKDNYDEVIKNTKKMKNVKIVSYLDNMTGLMKSVDVMVSRAGATSISEILALEVPTIFIPSPYVTNNHQYKNAMDLVNKNAGLIIEEKDLNGDILVRTIDSLIHDKGKINEIKTNLSSLAVRNSATMIYEIIKGMVDVNHDRSNK